MKDDPGVRLPDIKKYFESQLLPFSEVKELKGYEKGLRQKRKSIKVTKFQRAYKRFLHRRYKILAKTLQRLQNGKCK